MSDKIFDLFGDPVPSNWGERGRPEHIPTQQNRNRVSLLVALGWSNARIALALMITQPTLRKHYFSELKFRDTARDRLDANVGLKLWEGVMSGSVSAIREFRAFVDRNDLMQYGRAGRPRAEKVEKAAKQPKLGKKEEALLAAQQPDVGTPLGELMARRQQSMN
jgi:hypothetical protein